MYFDSLGAGGSSNLSGKQAARQNQYTFLGWGLLPANIKMSVVSGTPLQDPPDLGAARRRQALPPTCLLVPLGLHLVKLWL